MDETRRVQFRRSVEHLCGEIEYDLQRTRRQLTELETELAQARATLAQIDGEIDCEKGTIE